MITNDVLKANGRLSTTFIMSLHRFIPEAHRQRLEQLQGSKDYACFLRKLEPNGRFHTDHSETTLEEQGHALSIFRRRLLNTYFFPTYTLDAETSAHFNTKLRSNLSQRDALWRNWTFKLRLTRNGHVIVKMDWDVHDMALTEITRTLLQLQGAIPPETTGVLTEKPVTQWELAMDIAACFTEACGGKFEIEQQRNGRFRTTTICVNHEPDREPLPLHDRHLAFLFTQFTDNDRPLTADELRQAYAPQLFGLLQNTLLEENGRYTYPPSKTENITHLIHHDHANWQHELCLLTAESCLIYAPMPPQARIYFDGSDFHPDAYPNYWHGIARGIEYVVTLKSELQMIERITTQQLAKVPELTTKVADGNLSRSDTKEILDMAQHIGHLFHILPQMRDTLVPSSIFRAAHAVQIFQHTMKLLGLHDIEGHIETNVQELNGFLAYYNGMQIQYDAQKTNNTVLRLTIIFSLLTLIFSFITIPSFFQDGKELGWFSHPHTMSAIIAVPPATIALLGGVAVNIVSLVSLWLLITVTIKLYHRYRSH